MEDMRKEIEFIRKKVLHNNHNMRSVEKLFEEYLDNDLSRCSRIKIVDMLNYNDGDNWRKDL
jgi:hypothetical protein